MGRKSGFKVITRDVSHTGSDKFGGKWTGNGIGNNLCPVDIKYDYLIDLIPNQVRIPAFIVIIAAFVTIADRFMAAFYPLISKDLGPYVPLIVVNCIILGRAEAFASKNSVFRSILDSAGMGTGFILVLIALGAFREFLGSASIFGITILGDWFEPWLIMILPGGAFLGLGIFIGIANWINARKAKA